ncbi:hypothetical protein PAXINDRAFT_17351 [Paxillus involutus ATCC 200175]|uniref:Unplaced genomic scaffold PAXINscaffold_129, whole genome shotgun sequence n=1 Tax=Paxillus involutus ATCC 200175 TaxID=664439 RepID=A0A0C9SQE1_PAXIN|nr:hypothetical protein PAXINDRAFT_17351 [Paxillus involutus ATCC 200175]
MPSSLSLIYHTGKNASHLTFLRQRRNACLVGLSGIVIRETGNAFKIVTRKDHIKFVPKQNSVFALAIPLYSTLSPSTSKWESAQA